MDGRTPSRVRLPPSRVGLTGVEAVVRLGVDPRTARPFAARIECLVEPHPQRQSAPDSRVEAVLADAVRDVVLGSPGMRAERLAQEIAERARERLRARRAEAAISARFPERRRAPVSGTATQEISTLHARAVAAEGGTRRVVGVSAQGITTAPDAQRAVVARSRERLAAAGFPAAAIARILDRIPVATHDQLGFGTLLLGCPEDCELEVDVGTLLAIVEGAMSSGIFELMKRSDEGAVVERAHFRARAADDAVRAMLSGVVERLLDAPDRVFVSATQEHVETIRRHHVTAERAGSLGALRRELRTGERTAGPATMREWLDALEPGF